MAAATLRSRLESAIVRGLGGLRPFAQRLLSGVRHIRVDGLELDPSVQLILRLLWLSGHRDLHTMTPAAARLSIETDAAAFSGAVLPLARVEDHDIPGPGGRLRVRLYVPTDDGRRRGL